MNNITKFLIIEDNRNVIEAVSMLLALRWPHAIIVSSQRGEKGIMMAETENPDIIILDLGLPDISGFDVLASIRLFSDVPIIILTVRCEEGDIFKGLEMGADDYLVKPFKQLELLARLKALTRRRRRLEHQPSLIKFGPYLLNTTDRIFERDDKLIKLSHTECSILAHLMENAGRPVSHASIAHALWGNDYPDSASNLKVHIRRLRQKIEANPNLPELVITKPGFGYLFPNNLISE
ncbi:MAG: response regulator transcription factor [Dehalococcoidales bacterium]|jgi:two-component system KDP operon response regulator KdpE|nr:response regulator transcription factor [Dehalococcoidales bacterium]